MWVGMTRRIDPPTFAVHRDDAAGLVACASKISRANQLDSDVDHRPATPGLVHLELILHAGPTSERAIARPSHTMRESPPRKVDVSLRTPTHICDATLVTEPNPGADRRLHERLDALGPAPRAELRPSAEGPRGRGAEGPRGRRRYLGKERSVPRRLASPAVAAALCVLLTACGREPVGTFDNMAEACQSAAPGRCLWGR
jgi:hypothetical protein